jgi:hypothetical protein
MVAVLADGKVGPITRDMIATYRELVRTAEDVRP